MAHFESDRGIPQLSSHTFIDGRREPRPTAGLSIGIRSPYDAHIIGRNWRPLNKDRPDRLSRAPHVARRHDRADAVLPARCARVLDHDRGAARSVHGRADWQEADRFRRGRRPDPGCGARSGDRCAGTTKPAPTEPQDAGGIERRAHLPDGSVTAPRCSRGPARPRADPLVPARRRSGRGGAAFDRQPRPCSGSRAQLLGHTLGFDPTGAAHGRPALRVSQIALQCVAVAAIGANESLERRRRLFGR